MTRADVGLKFHLTGCPTKHFDVKLRLVSHKLITPPPVVRRKPGRSAKRFKRWRSQRSQLRLILQKQNRRDNPLLFIVWNNPTISLSDIKHTRGTDVVQDNISEWMFRQKNKLEQVFLLLRKEAVLTNAQTIQSVKRWERGGRRRKSDTPAQHNCGALEKQP